MEPQISDYYNQDPHMVKVIDNMNKELEDIQNKYSDLEKKYNKLKFYYKNDNFKICCTSIKDRNNKHKQMIDKIKKNCNEYIDCLNTTTFGRNRLYNYGISWAPHDIKFYSILKNELFKLSNNDTWASRMADAISGDLGQNGLRGREMPHWDKIYNSLTTDDIKDIMLSHIEYYAELHILSIYTFPEDDDY